MKPSKPNIISITKMLIGSTPYTTEYMDFFAEPNGLDRYSTQQVFSIVDKSTGMKQAVKSVNKNMNSQELLDFLKSFI